MKKYFISLAVISLLISCCNKEKSDPTKEKEAIESVIDGLLQAHANSNPEGWISAWENDSNVFLSYTANYGHFTTFGYDMLKKNAKENFDNTKKVQAQNNSKLSLEGYDYIIKVFDNTARAVFKVKWTSIDSVTSVWETFENYSLDKIDGVWKIASISAVNLTSFNEKSEILEEE